MKITVNTTKEVELNLPFYFKKTYQHTPPTYHAILTEDKAITIYANETPQNIYHTGPSAVLSIRDENETIIEPLEFYSAFESATLSIRNFILEAQPEPKQDETDMLNRLSDNCEVTLYEPAIKDVVIGGIHVTE